MEKLVGLNTQTAGRDKLARLFQYASRAVWDLLERNDASPAMADRFKTVEYILSTFRKLLRFGRCLDLFYASLRTIHYPDPIICVTLTLSKLSTALFLFADHLMWLARTGLFKDIDAKHWSQFANKYWLFSIIMNLCRDFYEIVRVIDLHKAGNRGGISHTVATISPLRITSPRDFGQFVLHSYSLMLGHKDVAVDTIKNICDLFIPLTGLGYTELTPRSIGILGAISSAAGLWALLEPSAKLVPV